MATGRLRSMPTTAPITASAPPRRTAQCGRSPTIHSTAWCSALTPLARLPRFRYDAAGQLTHAVAENGIVTRTDYDALGRITSEVRNERPGVTAGAAVNVTTRYSYDVVGNRIQQIDANGNATSYGYDLLDRLVQAEDAAHQVEEYTYDAVGNTIAFKNHEALSRSSPMMPTTCRSRLQMR